MKLEAAFNKTTNATSAEIDDYDNTVSVVLIKAAIWLDVVYIDLIIIFGEKSKTCFQFQQCK